MVMVAFYVLGVYNGLNIAFIFIFRPSSASVSLGPALSKARYKVLRNVLASFSAPS